MEKIFERTKRLSSGSLILFGALTLLTACQSARSTHPKRTATEQLLLSTATDRALRDANLPDLEDRTVYLDTTYLETFDQPYVIGSLRDLLFRNGALLQEKLEQADIIIEARSGALSTDTAESLAGIPAMPLPIPATVTVETPELPLFKMNSQTSVAKLALTAYKRESREHLFSADALLGQAQLDHYTLLGITTKKTKIPEKE